MGLDEEQVDAAVEQAAGLDLVGVAQLGEADLAERRHFVPGPMEPATQRPAYPLATSWAMRAAARLIS